MIITKRGVEKFILAITTNERFGSGGHSDNENRALGVVNEASEFMKNMPEELFIPDSLLKGLDGSVLGDIVAGYDRPLGYLCSDCRYPKWLMTIEEDKDYYSRKESVKSRPDGFSNSTGACPKCGD